MTRRINGSRPDMTAEDAELQGGSEREEVRRAPAGANLLVNPGGVRKKVRSSAPQQSEVIQAREMLARQRRAAGNRFLNEGDENLLPVPPDDEAYHYGFVRHSLNGRTDVSNMQQRLHGALQWEIAPIGELSPQWQAKLGFLKAKDGDYAGHVAIEDLVLMRCDRQAYEEYREAEQIRADRQVIDTKTSWVDMLDRAGMRPKDAFEVDELEREESFR